MEERQTNISNLYTTSLSQVRLVSGVTEGSRGTQGQKVVRGKRGTQAQQDTLDTLDVLGHRVLKDKMEQQVSGTPTGQSVALPRVSQWHSHGSVSHYPVATIYNT